MKKEIESRRRWPSTFWAQLVFRGLTCTLLVVCVPLAQCQSDLFEEPAHLWSSDAQESSLLQAPSTGGDVPSTRLTSLDVICGKEYMTVRAEFNSPFKGIVFSKGTYGQSKCVYVKPHSGLTHLTFNVRYDECGTKPDLQGKYFENTIIIQYGTDIIDSLDEAKRLRCEWFEAYEKPATFRPAIPVADLDIIEMNFQGDEIDCWMSIQEGKGPWSNEINRIVTVGQPLSLVVAINDHKNQFDMKVKSCFAHDGIKSPIYLIDQDGCVLRPGMFSQFQKFRNSNGGTSKASLISYAQFLAFKFPDSVDVQIQCTVEVCRHGCSNTCESDRSRGKQSDLAASSAMDNQYQAKPVQSQGMNRFMIENSDLLESASSNDAVAVDPVAGGIEDNVSQTNATKQAQRNIAPFGEDVEHRPIGYFDNTVPGYAEFNVATKVSTGTGPRANQVKPPGFPPVRMQHVPRMAPHTPVHSQPPSMQRPQPLINEPVAHVMNIPLSPMYVPGRQKLLHPHSSSSVMNAFDNLRLLKNKSPQLLPHLLSSYFGKNRRSQHVPNDNFEFVTKLSPGRGGQRTFRMRRFVPDPQGEVGLKRGFQVVTSLDLSFSPNMSGDQMPIYEGVPAPIVYGMCFSTTHFFYFVAVSLFFLFSGISSCVYIICRLERAKKSFH